MKLYYKDFVTGKRHFTQAKPTRAIKSGLMGAWGLHVESKSFAMFIPEYLLEAEGREILTSLRKEVSNG